MIYGDGNYTLKYVQKKNNKMLFDMIEPNGGWNVIEGNMDELKKILNYSPSLDINMDFKKLQYAIATHPIVFVAKRQKIENMNDLDFNI